MSIPNTITIYIKTNIYGESFLKLKPSMIDPTNKNNNILFDPLIKLDQNIVDKQGEKTRKAQFLEKPLFNSLITLSESFQPYRTLKQATKEGIIDNNINIMLKTFFKKGNTIYIKNKPYTAINDLWKKGNWKIDTKLPSSSSLTSQYPVNSIYYQHQMNNSYANAIKELNALPEDVRQGPNFKPEDFQQIENPQGQPGSIGGRQVFRAGGHAGTSRFGCSQGQAGSSPTNSLRLRQPHQQPLLPQHRRAEQPSKSGGRPGTP